MDVTLLDLVDEPLITRPDGYGITVREFEKSRNCSSDIARKLLEKAVDDGVLAKHLMIVPNERTTTRTAIYHRPDEWPPKE